MTVLTDADGRFMSTAARPDQLDWVYEVKVAGSDTVTRRQVREVRLPLGVSG